MNDKTTLGGANYSKRLLRKGSFIAEIKAEGNVYRFVIRDESRTRPTIHGSKKSMQETETEVKAVLDQLCVQDRAA